VGLGVAMKKPLIIFAIIAVIVLACGLIYWVDSVTTDTPKVTAAQFIGLRIHSFAVKDAKEPTADFQKRISAFAASLMSRYEAVTIDYYINEAGKEQAIVLAERKIWK